MMFCIKQMVKTPSGMKKSQKQPKKLNINIDALIYAASAAIVLFLVVTIVRF